MNRLPAVLLLLLLALPVISGQEPKPTAPAEPKPAKPKEPTLPDGITKGSTVEGLTEYKLKNGAERNWAEAPRTDHK